jgi:hypothetical protein
LFFQRKTAAPDLAKSCERQLSKRKRLSRCRQQDRCGFQEELPQGSPLCLHQSGSLPFSVSSFSLAHTQAAGQSLSATPDGSRTLFEAVDKQLGLKLKLQRQPMPVLEIDRAEQKPSENG